MVEINEDTKMYIYDNKIYQADLKEAIDSVKSFEKLKSKKIMITGASGLIGSFLVDMFVYANEKFDLQIKIYAIGRNRGRLIERFGYRQGLICIEQDVNQKIEISYKVDYVIHAASNAYPAAFSNDPVGTIMSNIAGTKNLLDFCYNCGAERFLFVSSGEVYGIVEKNLDTFCEDDYGYVDFLNVRSCYPSSKRAAETLCISYTKQFGLETVIARPCHTFGANVTNQDNRANVQFIKNVLDGKDIVMKSKGEKLRSYCYIADCASAILTILLEGESTQAYNIVNSTEKITILGFAQSVGKFSGKKVIFELANDQEKKNETPIVKQVLDGRKLEQLGWEGKFSIEEGIEHTVLIQKMLLESA